MANASTLPSVDMNMTSHDEVFKQFYIPMAEAAMNASTPFLSKLPQPEDFTGKAAIGAVRLSKGKGFGGVTIPQASTGSYAEVTYNTVPLYVKSELDYEAVVSAGDDKGAFFRVTSQEVADCLESAAESLSILCVGTGDGKIGTIDSVSGTDEPFTITITAATWFEPYYEEGMVINFASDTTPFVITSVVPASRQIVVSYHPDASAKTYDPSTGDIYLQNMKSAGFVGLETVADFTTSTLYGVTFARRWSPTRINASSDPISPEMLIECASKMYEKTKVLPTDCWVSPSIAMSLEQQLEGKVDWVRQSPNDSRFAEFGWDAIGIRTKYGKVPVSVERMIKPGRVYFTNSRMMKLHKKPGWGWITDLDKGYRYLRNFTTGATPKAEALYGGFAQFYAHPGFVGTIYGAANTDLIS